MTGSNDSALWHPFSNMARTRSAELVIDRGEDVWIWDEDGNRYLDATASLWYANVGHGRAEIREAADAQMAKIEAYSTFADFANRPAIELAARLSELAPMDDAKVFLGSGGGDAVDTAAKLAVAYWIQRGRPGKNAIVSRTNSYHGTHLFGTSIGGIEPNRVGWGPLLDRAHLVAHDSVEATAELIDRLGADQVAAIFVEPVIGAGGVIPPPAGYIEGIARLARENEILLVVDSVICGFGRLGTWFGIERWDVTPDMILFAKGVTSGYLPLGGVIVSGEVAEPFWEWRRLLLPPRGDLRRPRHLLRRGAGEPRHPRGRRVAHPRGRARGDAARLAGAVGREPARGRGARRHRAAGRGRIHARVPRRLPGRGAGLRDGGARGGCPRPLAVRRGRGLAAAHRHRGASRPDRRRDRRRPGGVRGVGGGAEPGELLMAHRVAVIPGDGVGPEVIAAAREVLAATGVAIEWTELDWGCERFSRAGEMAPDDMVEVARGFDAILLGAVGDPAVPDHVSLWGLLLPLRQGLDLWANLRPVKLLPGVPTALAGRGPEDIDMLFVRENTEGEYSGIGGRAHRGLAAEVAVEASVFTRGGVERVVRHGFELARERRGVLTSVTKSNASRFGYVLWDEVAAEVAAEFDDVRYERIHVDAMAARLVSAPGSLDVVVASNLFGDVLTDLGAAIQGGMGMAASASVRPGEAGPAIFEPVHGSAPDIAGEGIANPIGAIWSAALMLEHLGEPVAAGQVMNAVAKTCLRRSSDGGPRRRSDDRRGHRGHRPGGARGGAVRLPVSTPLGLKPSKIAVKGGVVGHPVLPAAPENPQPGPTEDPDRMGVLEPSGAGVEVDLPRPRMGVAGRDRRGSGDGVPQALVAGPPEGRRPCASPTPSRPGAMPASAASASRVG